MLRWIGMTTVTALSLAIGCGGVAVVDPPTSDPDGDGGSGGAVQNGAGGETTGSATTASNGVGGSSADSGSGQGGGSGDLKTQCQNACSDLFACTQEDDLCPGVDPAFEQGFISQCVGTCFEQPVLIDVVNPDDCAGTISTISSFSQEFAAFCQGGI